MDDCNSKKQETQESSDQPGNAGGEPIATNSLGGCFAATDQADGVLDAKPKLFEKVPQLTYCFKVFRIVTSWQTVEIDDYDSEEEARECATDEDFFLREWDNSRV